MTPSDHDDEFREIIEEAERRRRRASLCNGLTVVPLAGFLIIALSDARPSTALLMSIVLLALGSVIAEWYHLACPACGRRPGRGDLRNFCPECGVPLR